MNFNFYEKLEEINNNPNIDVLLDNLSVEYINHTRRLELIEQIRKAIKK
jgi:hypothetical protein